MRIICTKNYHKLAILLQITVDNVGYFFLKHRVEFWYSRATDHHFGNN